MDLDKLLQARGLSRRDFLKLCASVAAVLGLSEAYVPEVAEAVEKASRKLPVLWVKGQDCTGCSESTISTLNPSVAELVLDVLSIRYHETIMAASGDVANNAFADTVSGGGYLLVVEGAIPTVDDRFCMGAGESFISGLRKAAANAVAIVAAGSCAAYGGIPRGGPTSSRGVGDVISGKPIINLPSCPVKPTRVIGTVVHYLLFNQLPDLDQHGRPLVFYGQLLHDTCSRRAHYDRGEFLTDWNDPKQFQYCLLLKGCKGPKTYTDDSIVWWNEGQNYCINAGSPCSGCTQPEFYEGFTPLYRKQENMPLPGMAGVASETVGKAIVGATVAGIASHLIAGVVTKRPGSKSARPESKGVEN